MVHKQNSHSEDYIISKFRFDMLLSSAFTQPCIQPSGIVVPVKVVLQKVETLILLSVLASVRSKKCFTTSNDNKTPSCLIEHFGKNLVKMFEFLITFLWFSKMKSVFDYTCISNLPCSNFFEYTASTPSSRYPSISW